MVLWSNILFSKESAISEFDCNKVQWMFVKTQVWALIGNTAGSPCWQNLLRDRVIRQKMLKEYFSDHVRFPFSYFNQARGMKSLRNDLCYIAGWLAVYQTPRLWDNLLLLFVLFILLSLFLSSLPLLLFSCLFSSVEKMSAHRVIATQLLLLLPSSLPPPPFLPSFLPPFLPSSTPPTASPSAAAAAAFVPTFAAAAMTTLLLFQIWTQNHLLPILKSVYLL